MRIGPFKFLLFLLYAVSAIALLYFALGGLAYYATPLIERPRHPGYWSLKPGGPIGHGLGIVGSLMMVLLLLYSARKRLRVMRNWGKVGRWLDVHIWLGFTGPLFVILHTSFKVQGIVALSFWSMIAVATSGFLGRYLYLQIPRTRAGDELSLEELGRQDTEIAARVLELGVAEDQYCILESLTEPPAYASRTMRGALLAALTGPVRVRSWVRSAVRSFDLPKTVRRDLRECLLHRARLRYRIVMLDQMHCLFHYWHVVHKPFAAIMYIFMVVHVVVALMTGYGWRWG